MDTYPPTSDFERLSTAEKIIRLQDAWDRIAEKPERVEVTPEQKKELDARLKAMAADPNDGSTWQEIKYSLRK
jgi:putative addiction module component (TIGR02574 family)